VLGSGGMHDRWGRLPASGTVGQPDGNPSGDRQPSKAQQKAGCGWTRPLRPRLMAES
jgi:hypothetical protein